VFVGFGSMAPAHGEWLSDIVAAAVNRAGVRAVVQSGWAGLDPSGDDILLVGDLPRDWLFPRMAAVIHHAGAGTTGAGLRGHTGGSPCPSWSTSPSGRRGCTGSASRHTHYRCTS
jgi:UDP:flavonoid glycosyltransferase YjiC (YdhE family)